MTYSGISRKYFLENSVLGVVADGIKKYQEIIKILKKAGAKMDIPDFDGITPWQHAKSRGFEEIVNLLKSF